jgi:uncharacterized repeat protein (TIGR02543 family)
MKTKLGILGMLNIILASGMFLVGCNDGSVTTYTVTFNSNGGSAVDAISGISSGTTITLPQNPTKETGVFGGWFLDNETFQNEFTASTVVTQDITVYAKWNSINPYIGTWTWDEEPDSILQIFDNVSWELKDEGYNFVKGTYVYSDNNGTINTTHMWDFWASDLVWVVWDDVPIETRDRTGWEESFSFTLNGNTITLDDGSTFQRKE